MWNWQAQNRKSPQSWVVGPIFCFDWLKLDGRCPFSVCVCLRPTRPKKTRNAMNNNNKSLPKQQEQPLKQQPPQLRKNSPQLQCSSMGRALLYCSRMNLRLVVLQFCFLYVLLYLPSHFLLLYTTRTTMDPIQSNSTTRRSGALVVGPTRDSIQSLHLNRRSLPKNATLKNKLTVTSSSSSSSIGETTTVSSRNTAQESIAQQGDGDVVDDRSVNSLPQENVVVATTAENLPQNTDSSTADVVSFGRPEDDEVQSVPASSPFAYAFVIGGIHENRDAYKGFLYDVLIATSLLRKMGSTADFWIWTQLSPDSNRTKLPDEDVRLLTELRIRLMEMEKPQHESFTQLVYAKFRLLQMTQYQRVMFLEDRKSVV